MRPSDRIKEIYKINGTPKDNSTAIENMFDALVIYLDEQWEKNHSTIDNGILEK